MKTVYMGILYRFGYDLTVIGESEKSVRSALVKEYNRTYKEINGSRPTSDEIRRRDADIEIHEFTMGKVEWR